MAKKKSILIITPYFAPQTHAAVFRAYKIAKYLPSMGWDVHVLTVDKNYIYNEDPTMIEKLPSSVQIHKARYLEPTLRGLRMALGGRDRSFKSIKHNLSGEGAYASRQTWPQRLYQFFRKNLNIPDAYWTWRRPALRKALEIIDHHKIDVVMTSSSPYTTLEIGLGIKQNSGVKWVADFRDPLGYQMRFHSADFRIFKRQRHIEKMAIDNADAVTTLTSAHPLIFADMYGIGKSKRVHYIATGLDPDLLPKTPKPETTEPYLIFVGEFDPQYGDEFFQILKATFADPAVKSQNLKIRFVGRREINELRVMPMAQAHGVADLIEFVDHVPQAQVYVLIQKARAAVMCAGRTYPWWCSFAKMADYIALEKAVIAIVPDPSEARKWLQLTGLGVFLDGSVGDCAASLKQFLEKPTELKANKKFQSQFLADYQVREFDHVFRSLVKSP